jgi:phage head maturation protease
MSTAIIREAPAQERLDADAAALVIRSVISTAEPDRAGDVVVPSGLRNLDEFLRNPVVLWAHQRTLPPVGVCRRLEIQGDRIVAETQFAKGVPFAEDVFRLYEQGILRAWSIGFEPLRVTPQRRGLRYDEWNLLEYSAVPVPENPRALTVAVQKGLVQDETLKQWLNQSIDVFFDLIAQEQNNSSQSSYRTQRTTQ